MRRPRVAFLCGLTLAAAAALPESRAGILFHRPRGTPPPGEPRMIEHTHSRAGFPLSLSHFAAPSDTPAFEGYPVGGGLSHGGGARSPEEGTWGYDYVGTLLPRHVFLSWGHGRRYQGGTGAYKTDGPVVPDVIALTSSSLRHHAGESGSEP